MVSGNYFTMLGVKPALGRLFTSEEDDRIVRGHPVVALSYQYWVNRFDRDPNVIGKKILVNNYPDDHRRRLRARFRRSRSGAESADPGPDSDEGSVDAGVVVVQCRVAPGPLGPGLRSSEAGLHARVRQSVAPGPVPANPRV